MNKKFLSAILFGALMVSSTGTFVSCKDYDDDIDRIDKELTEVKSQIAALQKLVGEGKWVTNITSIENGFTVTMSDGTSQNVTGIKGADGKNGTEWTIGEDGFWYKDGEKTDSKAVATDGKPGTNGQTAPSPKINADGFWVVYEWDAAKGEFVEKTTEISAQGTSAYVVKKDGVYVLHIADETGKFQDVTLPATSDSFVAEAPYFKVVVKYETATWNKWNANKDDAKTLLKKYPELASIAKDTPMKQGGNLPILVTPANVELTDAFSFALQGLDGKTADIKISTPVKGLPVNTEFSDSYTSIWYDFNSNGTVDAGEIIEHYTGSSMVTRAAENDCFWSVKVDPAYDAKKKKYAEAENSSLSVTNAKGTTVKTSFAYNVDCDVISQDVNIYNSNSSVEYTASIDVFAKQGDKSPIFTKENDYAGYVVLEATNALQIEKYNLSTDGSKLIIGNMPANENSIQVALKVTVVGLNGSVASATANVNIGQSVDAETSLTPKSATLSKDAVKVRWEMKELNMSAMQLDQLMKGNVNFFISRVDADADKNYVAYNSSVKFYNDKNVELTTYSNGKWYTAGGTESTPATFGLDIKASAVGAGVTVDANYGHNNATYVGEMWMPKEYTVEMTSVENNTVIFSATTTLTVSNPDVTATYIKLVPAFVENNVFQITGTVAAGKVTYKLADGLILNNGAALKGFVDMDNKNYIDNGGDTNDKAAYGNYNWLGGDQSANANATLSVNVWKTKQQVGSTWTAAEWNQLYQERTIRAIYTLFSNAKNVVPFEYKVKVKSEIFSDTPADVIKMDATKLSAVFGGQNKTNIIDIQKAITETLVAAGTDKGKKYNLFGSNGSDITYKVTEYNNPKTNGDYVVNASGKPVAISADDLLELGMTMDQYIEYSALASKPTIHMIATDKPVSITGVTGDVALKGWSTLQTAFNKYYEVTGKNEIKFVANKVAGVAKESDIPAADQKLIALFNSYKAMIAFAEHDGDTETTGTVAVDSRIAANGVVIAFADALEAAKYFKSVANNGVVSGTTITAVDSAPADVTGGKVTVPMKISVTDIWGRTMVRTFDVTVTTK
jgi:hypothetical protein